MGKIDLIGNTDKLEAQDFNIKNFSVHPEYVRRTKDNDIALIKLSNAAKVTNFVHAACLYFKEDDPFGLIVTGWGKTNVKGKIIFIIYSTIVRYFCATIDI